MYIFMIVWSSFIHHLNKPTGMGNILYGIAIMLIIGWAIGYFGYAAGGLIHVLLGLAVVVIAIRLIMGRSPL
jgi:hypothetical protein